MPQKSGRDPPQIADKHEQAQADLVAESDKLLRNGSKCQQGCDAELEQADLGLAARQEAFAEGFPASGRNFFAFFFVRLELLLHAPFYGTFSHTNRQRFHFLNCMASGAGQSMASVAQADHCVTEELFPISEQRA